MPLKARRKPLEAFPMADPKWNKPLANWVVFG
ncbi:hypothetical protein TTX_2105 [Thermoproteus tenax Kra 1]|uniref:Uncharacterized protein n=1 Tax=Thermoproteus tenax (strain ATCC 35583 / DSM 2078 / JCM 9277 / NBRC 100435 / Kra 1) TaxID=768679 RepID=G4RMP1_THETK|nr:hypothetical protein TTX_2105 [Thermoproteus tenax Kra 1]